VKILITGAFGNLGLMCIEQALALGDRVTCFDLDTRANRRRAAAYSGRIDARFGDLRDTSLLGALVEDVDAILHNASVLPPFTEDSPEIAREINVTACEELIRVAESRVDAPVFVFPSSVTVFGMPRHGEAPRSADDPVEATDHYTRFKLDIEQTLRESSLPWVILRVAVSVDARTLATDRKTFRQLLGVRPENPFEYVHPKDVALAMCRAAASEEARKRVLLLGGGASCQVTQRDFLGTAFESLGLPLPRSCHGDAPYYTHWMDSSESQRILQYQRHDFSDYRSEMARKLRFVSALLFPVRWLVRPLLPMVLKRL
jgi:nucleoside-diphosphate-sugar epimerase